MGERASRRTPVGRGIFAVLGVLLVFGAFVGCGGGSDNKGEQVENEPARDPSKKEAAGVENVVVRVSGTPGTAFSGSYGTAREVRNVSATTLGAEPTDYEVDVEDEAGVLNATFKKTQPGREILQVEIVMDGEVLTRSETMAELGSVTVNWVPPETSSERTALPKEFEKERTK